MSAAVAQPASSLTASRLSSHDEATGTGASSTRSSSGTPNQWHQFQDTNPLRISSLLFSGGLAGAISRTATAPIDRLKMLLQVQEDAKGMSLREGMQKMAAEGTLRAYFRGNGANVIKIAPETAMKLTLNDSLKHWVARDPNHIQPSERMLSGGLAGAVAQGLLYPLDTIRTRLAVCSSGSYTGIMHSARRIWLEEGPAAFYRGLTPSMIGILPYAGVDIALFEISKEWLFDRYDGHPPSLAILGTGMFSSSVAQMVSYPLALIRTRLQAQGGSGGAVRYHGMMDVAAKTMRREGVKGLYKGMWANLIKLAPAAGISWYVFEETKMLLGVDPRS